MQTFEISLHLMDYLSRCFKLSNPRSFFYWFYDNKCEFNQISADQSTRYCQKTIKNNKMVFTIQKIWHHCTTKIQSKVIIESYPNILWYLVFCSTKKSNGSHKKAALTQSDGDTDRKWNSFQLSGSVQPAISWALRFCFRQLSKISKKKRHQISL